MQEHWPALHLCPACGARVPCPRGVGWVDQAAIVSAAAICGALLGALGMALLTLGLCTA